MNDKTKDIRKYIEDEKLTQIEVDTEIPQPDFGHLRISGDFKVKEYHTNAQSCPQVWIIELKGYEWYVININNPQKKLLFSLAETPVDITQNLRMA